MKTNSKMDWKLVSASQLAALAEPWDELQARTLPQAFLRSDFLLPLLDQFGQGNELLAYREDGIGWTAALLLQPQGKGRWNSFQPSQLPLGPVLLPQGEAIEDCLQALLRSLPGKLTAADQRLYQIPGSPPNMIHPPAGDPFAPRNQFATERCRTEVPPLRQVEGGVPGHEVAAWYDLPSALKQQGLSQ